MRLRVVAIMMLLALSCRVATADWQTIDFGRFKLKTPKTWNTFNQTGVEVYVAGLTNGKDSLWFNYGEYISGPANTDSGKYLYTRDTINGYSSIIMVPKKDSTGSLQLFIPHVSYLGDFTLIGHNIKSKNTVLNIFKTVTFFTSDTTKNSELTLSKFKEYPFGSGRTLFKKYCSPCHRLFGTVDGPRIQELIKERSPDWVYLFLTDRKQVAQDSLYLKRHEEFGASCMEYKDLSREDVRQILRYIKGEWLNVPNPAINNFNQ